MARKPASFFYTLAESASHSVVAVFTKVFSLTWVAFMKHAALVGFGSNQGDSATIYNNAVALISQMDDVENVQASSLIQTAPIGGPEQSQYSNGAIRFETQISAQELHQKLHEIENRLGRQRRVRWGPRSIDLDLLLFDTEIIDSELLTIPHPRMSFRRFVLEPAADIAPFMIHPLCQKSIEELIEYLDKAPNELKVVFDSEHENPAQIALERLAGKFDHWDFAPIPFERIHFIRSNPKLVVFWTEKSLRESIWHGPQFRISGHDFDGAVDEISAAIQATEPIVST